MTNIKVTTWNMQGGTGGDKGAKVRSFMNDADCVAVCLQECGSLFDWGGAGDAVPGMDGWTIACLEDWTASDDGNNRCSLAILKRGTATNNYRWDAGSDTQRPVVGTKVGALWVFSVHAPAGGDATYVADAVAAARSHASGASWLMAGDYNIAAGNAATLSGCELSRPGAATHIGGRELDYAYGNVAWTAAVGTVGTSDHAWVTLTL